MGKSLPSPASLHEFARSATKKLSSLNRSKPTVGNQFYKPEISKSGVSRGDSQKLKLKMENPHTPIRMPLAEVVSDCAQRWFQDIPKEGKAGDSPTLENKSYEPETSKSGGSRGNSEKLKLKVENPQTRNQIPLSEVVSDCAKRWFQDTLKEAKAGDIGMQVLVGQMYFSGYGVTTDALKGRAWISRASRNRSSVWRVSDKHPGYNASDSDSDELKDDVK